MNGLALRKCVPVSGMFFPCAFSFLSLCFEMTSVGGVEDVGTGRVGHCNDKLAAEMGLLADVGTGFRERKDGISGT